MGIVAGAACRRTIEVIAFPSDFVGVGVELHIEDGVPVVVRTLRGSPSELAGLRAGDRLVTIAGAPTEGVTLGNLVMRLRGAAGTQVEVTLQRRGEVQTLTLKRQAMQRDAQEYRPQGK
jgi:carboxyl-terminal processing protease